MDSQNKDEDYNGTESYGLKASDLLKALAERKSPPRDGAPNISRILSVLHNTGTGTSCTHEAFKSRAVFPEHVTQLSTCQFKRRDHLRDSLMSPPPVPASVTAAASSREGQRQPSSSNPIFLAHLLEKSKMLLSASIFVGQRLKKREMYPYILGAPSCELHGMQPERLLQTGPTNEWFFEDLTDLQMKLFEGASKTYGVQRTAGKLAHDLRSESASVLPAAE